MKCPLSKDPQSCSTSSCCCSKYRPIILLVLALVAGFGIYKIMTRPDDRTAVERIGDAVKQLPNGVDAATKELDDKSAAEKMGDSLKDMVK